MRVWNKTGDGAEDSKRLNFKMCRDLWQNIVLVCGNVGITFFIDIHVFHQTLLQKVVEFQLSSDQCLIIDRIGK